MAYDKLTGLLKALEIVRDRVYADIPVQRVIAFLEVAKNNGITQGELQKLTLNQQGTVSRTIKELGKYQKTDPKTGALVTCGHGLVTTSPAPNNPRAHACYLTSEGKKLANELDHLI